MFKEVIAAIDGSPAAFLAATIGAQLAEPGGGTVQLICVAEGLGDLSARLASLRGDHQEIVRRCEADLSSAQAAIGGLASVRARKVLLGRTADAILNFVEETEADLLCVGRGRHLLRLGSVSAALVRRATVPVVIVPAGVSTASRIRRIAFGFDGSDCALQTATRLGSISAKLEAPVQITFVLDPPWPIPPDGLSLAPEEVEKLAGRARGADLDQARALIEGEGGAVSGMGFELGDPATKLLEQAEASSAGLIVVGAQGHSATRRFILGGVSDKLASRSTLPVLVFR